MSFRSVRQGFSSISLLVVLVLLLPTANVPNSAQQALSAPLANPVATAPNESPGFLSSGKEQVAPSSTETVVAPFAIGTYGVQTTRSYSGTVGLVVSGVGQASGTRYSDAFYVYTDQAGNPLPNPSSVGWDLYINGKRHTSYVSPTPPYTPAHVYTFTINVVGNNRLWFGAGDTITGDNTGAYTITLTSGIGVDHSVSGRVTDGGGNPITSSLSERTILRGNCALLDAKRRHLRPETDDSDLLLPPKQA